MASLKVQAGAPDHSDDQDDLSKLEKMKPHVPGIVTFADHNRRLPWSVTYHSVVMFADISGFTSLCEKYSTMGQSGVDQLTTTLNDYLSALVEGILGSDGDILKFAGDAILAIWRVGRTEELNAETMKVVKCCLNIQDRCGEWDTDIGVKLTVKIGVSAGVMTVTYLGNQEYRHYVELGPAVTAVNAAEHFCQSGMVVMSPETFSYCDHRLFETEPLEDGKHVRVHAVIPRRQRSSSMPMPVLQLYHRNERRKSEEEIANLKSRSPRGTALTVSNTLVEVESTFQHELTPPTPPTTPNLLEVPPSSPEPMLAKLVAPLKGVTKARMNLGSKFGKLRKIVTTVTEMRLDIALRLYILPPVLRKAKPTKYHGQYRTYAAESMLKAYSAVKETRISIRKASMKYGVPYQTLHDRVAGKIDSENYGKETMFSKEEELGLVEHAETMARLGYGVSNGNLQRIAGEMALKFGRRSSDRPLSNCWLYGFLERWRERIASLKPSSLDANRARSTTPEKVADFFKNLNNAISDYGLQHKPEYIFNLDETGISPEHRPPNIIAPIKEKAQAVTSPRSCTTTLIACANAAGNFIPPYFVFKGKRRNDELMNGATPGAGYVMTDSGWSTTEVFMDYLQNHFLRHVRRPEEGHPILLLVDGHTTHTSPDTIRWARERNIHLFVLPAHSSHVLQPLDVAVFGPFKKYFYSECASFMKANMGQVVTKYQVASIACKAYMKALSPWNIVSAFKRAGIFPLDEQAVSPEKLLPCEAFRDTTPVAKAKAVLQGKSAVDEYLTSKLTTRPSVQTCACRLKKTNRPNPAGRDISSEAYLDEVQTYASQKENSDPQKAQKKNKSSKRQLLIPRPSTSGLNVQLVNDSDEDFDESEMDSSELCCVCQKFSPPNLRDRPYLKIVSWAQCDECGHWVHLSFCDKKTVLRTGDSFLCQHCV